MALKLVRDNIPGIIRNHGEEPVVRQCANDEEFLKLLLERLAEEAGECGEARTEEELIAELVDLHEVFETLLLTVLHRRGLVYRDFMRLHLKKRDEEGGFHRRFILVS